jgi:NADH:ubiquinone oxidoreductase subunit 4 (subunit M)
LPEAHVEASTSGSIILASLLLKLGGYGLLRVCVSLFYSVSFFFSPVVYVFCLISMFYAALIALRQIDIKRVIAYASISHMNFAVLGLFTNNSFGIVGGIFMMFNHGLVAAGLFYMVGLIYERYHTRLLYYYSGLAYIMPIFSLYFFILTLCNCSFPGTCTFASEFLILLGLIHQTKIIMFLSALVSLLNTGYCF